MSREGVAQTTGSAVGQEKKRGAITIDNFNSKGCYIRCPFAYYYCSSGSIRKHNKHLTAKEKYLSLQKYLREVTAIAHAYWNAKGKPSKEASTLIRNISFAIKELEFYDKNEYIVPLGTTERQEIKNKLSALRQTWGLNASSTQHGLNNINKMASGGNK